MGERAGLHLVSKVEVSFIQTTTPGAGVSSPLYEMRTSGIGGLKWLDWDHIADKSESELCLWTAGCFSLCPKVRITLIPFLSPDTGASSHLSLYPLSWVQSPAQKRFSVLVYWVNVSRTRSSPVYGIQVGWLNGEDRYLISTSSGWWSDGGHWCSRGHMIPSKWFLFKVLAMAFKSNRRGP